MTVQDIFPAEVSLWRQRGARLTDIREPGQYAGGHLPGAVNIPLAELQNTPELSLSPVLLGGTIGWMRKHRPVDFPEVGHDQR